jgi:hypothetical protein
VLGDPRHILAPKPSLTEFKRRTASLIPKAGAPFGERFGVNSHPSVPRFRPHLIVIVAPKTNFLKHIMRFVVCGNQFRRSCDNWK